MAESSWLEIDLSRLDRNVATIHRLLRSKQVANGSGPPQGQNQGRPRGPNPNRQPAGRDPMICAVVKKNGYGLGAVAVAHRLVKAGCEMLAVYGPEEAEELIRNALTCPILLMKPLRELGRTNVLYRHAVAEKLHLTIHDCQQLEQVNAIGRGFGIRFPVHLHLDTGMSRLGLNTQQFRQALGDLANQPHLHVAGIYSHLATAASDPALCYEQLERFEQAVADHADQLPGATILHLANTCGMLRNRRFHLDMVRIGIGLLGYGPEMLAPDPALAETPKLEPVLQWISRVIHVQTYPRRTPVGYGATHRLRRDSVLGVVPVGFGDGYPPIVANKATVRVCRPNRPTPGQTPGSTSGPPPGGPNPSPPPYTDARVLGQVSMDQLIIDLTEAVEDGQQRSADAAGQELVGALVQVVSADPEAPNSLPNLAALAKSHVYEMLCRLSPTLTRRYLRT